MQILGLGKTALEEIQANKTVLSYSTKANSCKLGNCVNRIRVSGGTQIASFNYLSTNLEALFLGRV